MTIYERWKKTPMANVVRDPREHPDAIIPTSAPTKSRSSQRIRSLWSTAASGSSDISPKLAMTTIRCPRNGTSAIKSGCRTMFRTRARTGGQPSIHQTTCSGPPGQPATAAIPSITTSIPKQVTEWNVGCERCHGPEANTSRIPPRSNILNPARMDDFAADDTCIQCHSQGQPKRSPIEGKYYDWPVGYHVGLASCRITGSSKNTTSAKTNFTHFPDGTAHKNRMQGNDFVQSVMYRHGVTCSSCHDVHGTSNYAQLPQAGDKLCLDCHGPVVAQRPAHSDSEAHTHHKAAAPAVSAWCHMPKIEDRGRARRLRRSHTFQFISPAMTDKYKIPNPCTSCHTDKSTAWATQQMLDWNSTSPWRVTQ